MTARACGSTAGEPSPTTRSQVGGQCCPAFVSRHPTAACLLASPSPACGLPLGSMSHTCRAASPAAQPIQQFAAVCTLPPPAHSSHNQCVHVLTSRADYAAEGLLDGPSAAPHGQSSPAAYAPLCQNGSGDLQAESMQVCAAGAQQAGQQWQRAGSVPPTGGPPASVLLHTPAVAGQLSPKRRKLGEDSIATAPMLPLPPHLQQHVAAAGQHGGGGAGTGAQAPGVFQSPPDATGSRHDESAGFAGVLRVASAGRDEWHAYLRWGCRVQHAAG